MTGVPLCQEINASIKASFVNCSESSVDNLVELIQENASDCLDVRSENTVKMNTLRPQIMEVVCLAV